MPHSPPVPVRADFWCPTKVLVITWDRLVVTAPTAINNWAAVANCVIFPDRYANPAPGLSTAYTTTMVTQFTGASAGANRVSYFATPPDVISYYGGIPAAPFTGLLLVIHH